MSRPATGQVVVQTLLDGTQVFKLRFQAYGRREHEVLHERRDCQCGCGGGWNERTAHVELENILAKVRAGVWRKRQPPPPPVPKRGIPTFHEYASDWLEAKRDGVLGDRPISRQPTRAVALLATRFDVLWVMRQVGHADSHMTVDVYAQLQQRVERQPGEEFDKLVRRARERLYGTVEEVDGEQGKPQESRLEDLIDEWRDGGGEDR